MDLSYSQEHEAFRQEVISFLKNNWPVIVDGKPAKGRAAQQAFRKKAIEAGYLYRSVPQIYGGSEQEPDVIKAQIIGEEFGKVRAPREAPGIGNMMLVPTLLECGTEEQCERFIPGTLSGEIRWAQGYSEPNSGSDLASLKTRAELKDGKWYINGQKIWSSLAQYADYMFVLCRTEPDTGIKQEGISYLLVDLKQPGITIRPLKQITGGEEFCEVFFDDAETPASWIVGERGKGWAVSKATLSHERSSIGGANTSVNLYEKVVQLAKDQMLNGQPAIKDPVIQDRLVQLKGMVDAHLYSSYRQLSMQVHQQNPGHVTLMNKLINTNVGHEVAKLARDIIQDNLMILPPTENAYKAGSEKWLNQFFGSLGVAIAGGTSNIQRNIIAERGLGVVKEEAEN